MRECGYEGILAISIHYTIEGTTTNQFRELVRYLVGLPLEEPRLVAPTVMKNILGQDLEAAERIAREPHEGSSSISTGRARAVPSARWATSRSSA